MSDQVKLSVVIPYYRAPTLADQLESLTRQTWSSPWEVVVSDNEGTDGLKDTVRSFKDRLRLRMVDSSDRRGAGHARNVGVEAAQGQLIAFCDADDEVGAGWLAAVGDALLRHEFIACRAEIEKLNPDWIRPVFANDSGIRGLARFPVPPYLPYAGGNTLAIRRPVHARIGGFDESLRDMEDIDYCLRVGLSGTQLNYVPEAVVHYRLRTSIPVLFEQARRRGKLWARLCNRYSFTGSGKPRSPKLPLGQLLNLYRSRSQALSSSLSSRAVWFYRLGWNIGILQGVVK